MKTYENDAERKEARAAAVRKATKKYQESKKRVNAYFEEDEYTLVETAAKKQGVTPGRFVRDAAIKEARRKSRR